MLRQRRTVASDDDDNEDDNGKNKTHLSRMLLKGALFTWRWRLYLVLIGICALCLYALATTSLVEWSGTNKLAHSTASLSTALREEITRLDALQRSQLIAACDRIMLLNSTLTLDILLLMDALNMTREDGQSFQQDIEARLDTLEFLASLKLETINGVSFDNATWNIGLSDNGSNEILIVPNQSLNAVNISNEALLDIISPDDSFSINETFISGSNTFELRSNGVRSLEGVYSADVTNNLELLGAGMVAIYTNTNTSTITIDGSMLEMAIANLQTQADTQWMQIDALQISVSNTESQLEAIQLTLTELEAALNSTILSTNMTLTQLIADILQLQQDVALQEAYVTELSSNTSVPTGAIVPYSGTSADLPVGYLFCDGALYNISDYAALYATLGTAFCNGMCTSGTFAVPDMRGRVAVAKGGTAFAVSIGMNVGAETHTVSSAEMPAHSHSSQTADSQHSHLWTIYTHSAPQSAFGVSPDLNPPVNVFKASNRFTWTITPPNFCLFEMHSNVDVTNGNWPPSPATHTHAFTANSAGGGTSHANVQTTLITEYIVKT